MWILTANLFCNFNTEFWVAAVFPRKHPPDQIVTASSHSTKTSVAHDSWPCKKIKVKYKVWLTFLFEEKLIYVTLFFISLVDICCESRTVPLLLITFKRGGKPMLPQWKAFQFFPSVIYANVSTQVHVCFVCVYNFVLSIFQTGDLLIFNKNHYLIIVSAICLNYANLAKFTF